MSKKEKPLSLTDQAELNRQLHEVCTTYYGKLELAKTLLEQGADLEAIDKKGNTPLLNAIRYCNFEFIEYLIIKGANIEAADERGETPILHFCLGNSFRFVELLVNSGANINVQNKDGTTPLIAICKKGDIRIFDILLNKGANIEAQDNQGKTALLMAVQENKHRAVECLLKRGANPLVQDIKGNNAFDLITKNPNEEPMHEFKDGVISPKKPSIEIIHTLFNDIYYKYQSLFSHIEQLQSQVDKLKAGILGQSPVNEILLYKTIEASGEHKNLFDNHPGE